MTCLVCKITGCNCLFAHKVGPTTGLCFLCGLGAKCPLEKKVEIEEKRNNANQKSPAR
jgi:hypothetical protein